MNKRIFEVYLAKEDSTSEAWAKLDLPARPWTLLDVLDQVRLQEGESLYLEIEDYYDYEELEPYLANESVSLYALNALAEQLATLNDIQRVSFWGLLQMESNKREGPITLQRIRDLAASVDCCHVVGEALNTSQLGRFYAENCFVPEVENLTDEVFELLDFGTIGLRAQKKEGGVFTPYGYVVQHSDLEQVPTAPDHIERPAYIFQLDVWIKHQVDEHPIKTVRLELPAAREQLAQVLKETGAASWDHVACHMEDSAVPFLLEDVDHLDGIDQINDLAAVIKQLLDSGRLPEYKAVLEAIPCGDIESARRQAGMLDTYDFKPDISSSTELAIKMVSIMLDEIAVQEILPHLKLYEYGEELLDSMNGLHTKYGFLNRKDGLPIQSMADQLRQSGMEMK